MTGYLRYLNEVRPVVSQSVKLPKEVPSIVAAQWKKLDEGQKQKYNQAYLNEKVFEWIETKMKKSPITIRRELKNHNHRSCVLGYVAETNGSI